MRYILLAVMLAFGAAAGAQEHRLSPVDEASGDPSWVSFRNRLLTALQKRDRKFLLGITDRNVRNSTSGGRGIAEFQKQWDLGSDESPLWRELPSALFLGAAYIKRDKGARELCAPYVLGRWPEDIDPFAHGAIVAKEAAMKSEPSSAAATLQNLAYDIVPVLDWEVEDRDATSPQRWVKIRARAGEGYVPEEHVRSPVEHAACFVKGPSGWRMVAFAPAGGD
jgi:hypothetical protein